MDKTDVFMIGLIAILLTSVGLLIADVAYHHYQKEHAKDWTITEGWEPPVIPSCNKEIWDRIREGCDEQLDEGED